MNNETQCDIPNTGDDDFAVTIAPIPLIDVMEWIIESIQNFTST